MPPRALRAEHKQESWQPVHHRPYQFFPISCLAVTATAGDSIHRQRMIWLLAMREIRVGRRRQAAMISVIMSAAVDTLSRSGGPAARSVLVEVEQLPPEDRRAQYNELSAGKGSARP